MILGYVKIYQMRRSLRNFNIDPPLGKPRIFDHHLQRGSGEFDLCLRRVGNLNRGCQVKLVFKVCLGISSGANLWFADILYSFEA